MNRRGLLGTSSRSYVLFLSLVGPRLRQPLKVVRLGLFMESLLTLLDLLIHFNGFFVVSGEKLLLHVLLLAGAVAVHSLFY